MQAAEGSRREARGPRPAEAIADSIAEARRARRRARRSSSTGDDVDLDLAADPALLARGRRPFVTLPLVITKDPGRQPQRRHVPRAAVRQRTTWSCTGRSTRTRADRTGAAARGGRLPVAVAIGCRPDRDLLRERPLPKPTSTSIIFAGFLAGEPVEMVAVPDRRPAGARRTPRSCSRATSSRATAGIEGPFGDHTGFYTPRRAFPVFHVTAMTMRRDPIYPSIVVGVPPHEDELARRRRPSASSCRCCG